jgi:hypothetical protein
MDVYFIVNAWGQHAKLYQAEYVFLLGCKTGDAWTYKTPKSVKLCEG